MILVQRKNVSYVCMCERREESRETQDRLDEKRILKKKEMYINKQSMRYKVALQGDTSN